MQQGINGWENHCTTANMGGVIEVTPQYVLLRLDFVSTSGASDTMVYGVIALFVLGIAVTLFFLL